MLICVSNSSILLKESVIILINLVCCVQILQVYDAFNIFSMFKNQYAMLCLWL